MRCSRHCRGLVSWCHRFGYLRDVKEGINGLITDILSFKATNTLLFQPLHPTTCLRKVMAQESEGRCYEGMNWCCHLRHLTCQKARCNVNASLIPRLMDYIFTYNSNQCF